MVRILKACRRKIFRKAAVEVVAAGGRLFFCCRGAVWYRLLAVAAHSDMLYFVAARDEAITWIRHVGIACLFWRGHR